MWLSTYRSFNIQLTSSDYSKLLLFVYILKLVWFLVLLIMHVLYCVLFHYCIQTIVLCLPTYCVLFHYCTNTISFAFIFKYILIILYTMFYSYIQVVVWKNPIFLSFATHYSIIHSYGKWILYDNIILWCVCLIVR